jgi:glucose-6-phosphate isomerase
MAETLSKKVNPETTLFMVASKFTTVETMTNAHTARSWFWNSENEARQEALCGSYLPTPRKWQVRN